LKIIGIHGKARSGKDTLAAFLVDHHGFTRVGLADPLREFVGGITEIPVASLMDGPTKEEPIDWLSGKSPRQMMQSLGTEWGRESVDKDLWLKVAAKRIRKARQAGAAGVVIPDIRFDNEAEFVEQLGGFVVEVTREGTAAVAAHASENGVSAGLIYERITNNGPLHELAMKAQLLSI